MKMKMTKEPVRGFSTLSTAMRCAAIAVTIGALVFASNAEARTLTSTEKTNVHTWLATIANNGPSNVSTAKTSLETLMSDSTVDLTEWNSVFVDYFDASPGNLMTDYIAEYLQSAPLSSSKTVEYRKRFQTATISGAGERLITRIESAGGIFDLGQLMNDSCTVREDVLQTLELLDKAASEDPFGDLTPGSRNIFYDTMKDLVQNIEPALQYDEVYTDMFGTTATQPWAGPIRARLLRAVRAIKPADSTGRVFSTDFSMPTQYGEILTDHNVMIQDNGEFVLDGRLQPAQDLLDSLPSVAEKPEHVAVKQTYGNVCPMNSGLRYPPTLPSQGGSAVWGGQKGCTTQTDPVDGTGNDENNRCLKIGVNVHDEPVTGLDQTLFPQSESRWPDASMYNQYCHVLSHEVAHPLRPESDNTFYPNFSTQESKIIERACANPLNYLRSKAGSFCGNGEGSCTTACTGPGKAEFFSNIAQMFFMDTEKTLKVAHRRMHCKELDNVFHSEPMNQFLLFANVMATSPTGTTTVPFYQAINGTSPITDYCDLTPDYYATITRNSNGCITSISYQPPGQSLRQFAFTISTTNPTHCVVGSMSPSFASVYPAEGGSTNCPQ